MSVVEVDNRCGVAVDTAAMVSQATFVCDHLGLHPRVELAISLVSSSEIAELHETWLELPGPTDVLSFPMDELRVPDAGESPQPGMLGDVVICPEVAAEQGARAGHGLTGELELLLTHGILHLVGHDHAEPEEHAIMFGLQDQLIGMWRERR